MPGYPASGARARGVPPVSVLPFAGGAALAEHAMGCIGLSIATHAMS
jgi:hypothetical protein